MTDYREEAYRLMDETILPKLVLTLFISVSLGIASFLVLNSYQATPNEEINISELYDNETKQCLDPETLEKNGLNTTDYSEYVCKPENDSEVNKSANFSTIPDNKTVMKERCQQRNGTLVYGNQTNETISESGVFCKL